MPFYTHKCIICEEEEEHMYSINKDPKEIKCSKCNGNTERLISHIHIGWERKYYNPLVKSQEEREEAENDSHMGKEPYSSLSGESLNDSDISESKNISKRSLGLSSGGSFEIPSDIPKLSE